MHSILSLLISASPLLLHDTDVLFDDTLVAKTESSAFVSVRASRSLVRSEPIAGARVALKIADRELARAETDGEGRAALRFVVPALEPGNYVLSIATESAHGTDTIERPVRVVRKLVLSVRTDRGVYRPGETIRFGVALLNRPDAHPIGGQKVEVTVKEPRGTEIWRGQIDVGDTGFGSGKVALGDDLRFGDYKIEASVFSDKASVEVSVRDVELPSFFVSVDRDGLVVARYPYGEPVRGKVEITAGDLKESGELDEFGRHSLSPSAMEKEHVLIRVIDGAERSESAAFDPPRPGAEVSVVIVPERSDLAVGRRQFVTVVTTDGDGNLAPAEVSLAGSGIEVHGAAVRASKGAVRYLVTPQMQASLHATAKTVRGKIAKADLELPAGAGGPWIRPVHAVHESGQGIEVFGRFGRSRGPVVLTLVRGQIPLAAAIADPDAKGYFTAKLYAPEGVFGLTTVRASEVGWNTANGELIDRRAAVSIYLVPARLDVSLEGAARFRPRETAELTALVKDASGRPAPNVGLFASVVDERSLALGKKQKDLVELLKGLDVENADLLGLAFTDLLALKTDESTLALRAIVESLPPEDSAPTIEIEAAARYTSEQARMPDVREAAIAELVKVKGPIGEQTIGGWRFSRPLSTMLARAGWAKEKFETPWKRRMTWSYAQTLDRSFAFENIAREVSELRMYELAEQLRSRKDRAMHAGIMGMISAGEIGDHLGSDSWGGAFALSLKNDGDLRSAGADGNFGTGDDLVATGVFSANGIGGLGTRGYGAGGGGFGSSVGLSAGRAVVMGPPAALRSRFDETVLWAAGLRTDAAGKAILRVPFSDSVTGWKLAVDALGPNGAVGHGDKRLETFLPLSVDAAVPGRLTIGDRYTLSAVAANHTEEELSLAISMRASGAIELQQQDAQVVKLPRGTTAAARFPIRATSAGLGSIELTLAKEDGRIVDRVKRTIKVESPGRMMQVVLTSQVSSSPEKVAFDVPSEGEDFEGRLRAFRNPVDQALDGIEDLLSEPHGCFEQTSSATYPNLMVLQLLEQSKDNAELREKAYDLVAKGYQRLIAYEVGGGGFSWFGEAPANQALTAYGLLEFADMAKVYPVDPRLVERTRAWLLSQQRESGAWSPDATWLHDWSAVEGELAITTYVTWALVESSYRGPEIDRALAFIERHQAELEKKPYLLALWAAASRAPHVLAKLREHEKKDAHGLVFGAGGETLFYVKGAAADVQVTALAAPLLKATRAYADAGEAMKWIWSARTPRYGWGSPQGTVLALRAAAQNMTASKSEGKLAVALDGASLGSIDLDGGQVPTLALPKVKPGAHEVVLGGAPLLADLRLSWRTKDASAPIEEGLAVRLSVPEKPVRFGATARVRLFVENKTGEDVPMPTAIIPVPPGFAPSKRSLAALEKARLIDRFEANGGAVHLYLTKLVKREKIELSYDLIASAECEVTQRAARVYAYYDPDTRGESANAKVSVTAEASSIRP